MHVAYSSCMYSFGGLMLTLMILGPIGAVYALATGRWLALLVFLAATLAGVAGWRLDRRREP